MNRPLHLQCRSVVVEASIRMIWKEIITVALEAGDLGVEALEVVFNASVNATNDVYDTTRRCRYFVIYFEQG